MPHASNARRAYYIYRAARLASWWCAFLVLTGPGLLAAQPITVVTYSYDTEDGLPSNLVKDVALDRDGFAWLATDGGLVRFDGQSTVVLTMADGLPSDYVKTVYETRAGRLLAATDLGVVEIFSAPDSIALDVVQHGHAVPTDTALFYPKAVHEDGFGALWLSDARRVYRLEADALVPYTFEEPDWTRSYTRSFLFAETVTGQLVISSQQGGLYRYDRASDRMLPIVVPGAAAPEQIDALAAHPGGELWVGTADGLYALTLHAEGPPGWRRLVEIPEVQAITVLDAETAYVGTGEQGVYLLRRNADGEVDARPFTEMPLPSPVVHEVRPDREGNLLVGTDNGLAIGAPAFFAPFLTAPMKAIQFLSQASPDVLVGTGEGTVFTVDTRTGPPFRRRVIARLDDVSAVAADMHRVWVGTRNGELHLVAGTTRRRRRLPDSQAVAAMTVDGEGRLWTAHAGPGVYRVESDLSVRRYGAASGLPEQVQAVKVVDGQLYATGAATDGYLFRYDPDADRFVNISGRPDFALPTDLAVQDLDAAVGGGLWLASNHGLLHYSADADVADSVRVGARVTQAVPADQNGAVRAVAADDKGGVWVGTNRAFYYYHPTEGGHVPFSIEDGLQHRTVGLRSVVADGQGRIWVGTYGGVSYLQRVAPRPPRTPVPVFLEHRIQGRRAASGAEVSYPTHASLTARFGTLLYPGHRVRYQTRLLGLDDAWTEPTEANTLVIPRLQEGAYTLQVRAQQTGYRWSPPLVHTFRVRPPWYRTPWAFAGGVMLLGLVAGAGASYLRGYQMRRHAERALRESERKYAAVVADVRDVLFETDTTGRFTVLNPAWTVITGFEIAESLQHGLDAFIHPSDTGSYHEALHAVLQSTGGTHRFEVRLRTRSGEERWVEVQARLFVDDAERIAGTRGVMSDITDQRVTQAALRAAKEAAERADRAKSDFLAKMSHEIRTPMNGVIGMTELLEATPLATDQRHYVTTIQNSGELLLNLINDILDFSKIEAGKLHLLHEPYEIRRVVLEAVELLAPRAAQKGLRITFDVADRVPNCLMGDGHRLVQILTNLLANAVKFTEEGGIDVRVVPVAVPAEHGIGQVRLRFTVSDTGIGIPEADRDRLFAAFAQADDSTARKYGGSGLGLSIAKQLVQMMDGTIGVESIEGRGSTFWFTIRAAVVEGECTGRGRIEAAPPSASPGPSPARPATLEVWSGRSGTPAAAGAGDGADRPPRVLLAEDNLVNQDVAATLLQAFGLEVDVVSNGADAVQAVATRAYALVLMDCQMPGMDGYAATRAIRALPGAAGRLPVLALTAHAMQGDREVCLAAGMNDYLAKPIKREPLRALLGRWLPLAAPPTAVVPTAPHPTPLSEEPSMTEAGADPALPVEARIDAYLHKLEGDFGRENLSTIVEKTLAAMHEKLQCIGDGLTGGSDAEAVQRAAHSLKGSYLLADAEDVRALCADLEAAAERGLTAADAPLWEELQAAIAAVERGARRFL